MARGGFREKAIAIPVEGSGLVLEGLWQVGERAAAVIAPPHPEYGGSMDNPVVNELAWSFHRAGYASVRFNWRGVGASQGRSSGDPAVGEADYAAALEHLDRTCDLPITAAGYSFGAAIALRIALRDRRVRALLLVAPPLAMVEALPLQDLDRPVTVIVGGRDAFAPAGPLLGCFDPARTCLEVIPEADHFFFPEGLSEVRELARAALE